MTDSKINMSNLYVEPDHSIKQKHKVLYQNLFLDESISQSKFETLLTNTKFFDLDNEWILEFVKDIHFSPKRQAFIIYKLAEIDDKRYLCDYVIGSESDSSSEYWSYLDFLTNKKSK